MLDCAENEKDEECLEGEDESLYSTVSVRSRFHSSSLLNSHRVKREENERRF